MECLTQVTIRSLSIYPTTNKFAYILFSTIIFASHRNDLICNSYTAKTHAKMAMSPQKSLCPSRYIDRGRMSEHPPGTD